MANDNGRGFVAPTYTAIQGNSPTGVGDADTYVLPSDDRQIDPDNDGDVHTIKEFAGQKPGTQSWELKPGFALDGCDAPDRFQVPANESSYDRIGAEGGEVITQGKPGKASKNFEKDFRTV